MTDHVTKIRGVASTQAVPVGKNEGAGAANDHGLPARDQPPGIGDRAVRPTGADADKAVSLREIKVKKERFSRSPYNKSLYQAV